MARCEQRIDAICAHFAIYTGANSVLDDVSKALVVVGLVKYIVQGVSHGLFILHI